MAEVNVEIAGRKYRMACEDGQQKRLIALAQRFDGEIESLRSVVGEIGDGRLTVMAGISVMDRLSEAERRIGDLEAQISQLTEAGQDLALEIDRIEARMAERVDAAARAIETVAGAIDETATSLPR